MHEVYRLIRSLGATSKYKGYHYLAEAVTLSLEIQDGPVLVTKDIYPVLARRFHDKVSNVEQDIRTIVNVTWKSNREKLEEIAGYHLFYRPSNSEYIDILAFYLRSCLTGENRSGNQKRM